MHFHLVLIVLNKARFKTHNTEQGIETYFPFVNAFMHKHDQ